MPAILLTMLTALGKVLLSMVTALFTEKFLKTAIIHGLEKLVVRTQSNLDDQLLAAAKEAWGYTEPKSTDQPPEAKL